jgi:hypothetical protein
MLTKLLLPAFALLPFFFQKSVPHPAKPMMTAGPECTATCVYATNMTAGATLKSVIVSGCSASTTTTLNLPPMTSGTVNQTFTCAGLTIKVGMQGVFTGVSVIQISTNTVLQTLPYNPALKYYVFTITGCPSVYVKAF